MTSDFGQPNFSDLINRYRPDLTPIEDPYKDINRHLELGKQESRIASLVIEHLEAFGPDVEMDMESSEFSTMGQVPLYSFVLSWMQCQLRKRLAYLMQVIAMGMTLTAS